MNPHLSHLHALRAAVTTLRENPAAVTPLNSAQTHALLAALPPAFTTVWSDLLNRLESGAMFNEDSCSFSQSQVLDSMSLWLDKAEARLGAQST